MQTSAKAFYTQLLHISKHVAMTQKQSYFWFLQYSRLINWDSWKQNCNDDEEEANTNRINWKINFVIRDIFIK